MEEKNIRLNKQHLHPDDVTGFFNRPNPSSRTMVLGVEWSGSTASVLDGIGQYHTLAALSPEKQHWLPLHKRLGLTLARN
jgi:hypothetical protein